jgi:hypothetical protein
MTDRIKGPGPYTPIYVLGTLLYLLAVGSGAHFLGFFDPGGRPIGPSEWGDVLAGLFSPLAFLWLLYAALSQRAELELQREELARNNETQQEQQKEMNRQADALIAQTKRLEAQANATYEPIFILRAAEGEALKDSFLILTIQNVGGTALNVHGDAALSLRSIVFGKEYPGANVPAEIVAFWPAEAKVRCMFVLNDGDREEPSFYLTFRRLDAQTVTHKYVLTNGLKRIELREATYEELVVHEDREVR